MSLRHCSHVRVLGGGLVAAAVGGVEFTRPRSPQPKQARTEPRTRPIQHSSRPARTLGEEVFCGGLSIDALSTRAVSEDIP